MNQKAPFQNLIFNLNERVNGRVLFTMKQVDDDAYEMHVEKGPASQLTADFTRTVPRKTAEGLRDALAEAGVFGWDEEYGDEKAPGSRRWTLKIVFQEGVYVQESRGGSDVPEGFDGLLEALYRLDVPRPGADDAPLSASAGMASADAPDIASLFAGMPGGGPNASVFAEMQQALTEMQNNPEQFQRQLKEEFRRMPYEQQEQLIDMLSATGMGDREWWSRFLRG